MLEGRLRARVVTERAQTLPSIAASPPAGTPLRSALPLHILDRPAELGERQPVFSGEGVAQAVWNLRDPFKGNTRCLVLLHTISTLKS